MKVNSMKFGVIALAASLAVGTASCNRKGCTDPTANNFSEKAKKDDGSCTYDVVNTPGTTQEITKAGMITANETWTADNIYVLAGKVVVDAGVTLTIEPGTIVKGEQGTGTLASALVVAQGGKLNAVGTASAPIIFTSVLDNIQAGELTGTNLTENDKGLWGGIIVLGYAPISAADGDVLAQIEGIPSSDAFGAYGGNDAADNSGTMAYISIRHGGALIGAGNEINGLTLGGVGTGTSISNVEVVANLDDGVEFFGGTVDASNILVGWQGDDGVDIDMNYSGTVSEFVVINDANSDEGLEIDGPEGITYTSGLFTLQNGWVRDEAGNAYRGDFKSKAQGTIDNVVMDIAKVRASYQNNCVDPKTDAFTYLTDANPSLVFVSTQFTAIDVYTASEDDNEVACYSGDAAPGDQAAADAAATSSAAAGASTSGFASWTWTGVNGKL